MASAAALQQAVKVAETGSGGEAEQVAFGMWMGVADGWRNLAVLLRA
jgi:hypothetical protein